MAITIDINSPPIYRQPDEWMIDLVLDAFDFVDREDAIALLVYTEQQRDEAQRQWLKARVKDSKGALAHDYSMRLTELSMKSTFEFFQNACHGLKSGKTFLSIHNKNGLNLNYVAPSPALMHYDEQKKQESRKNFEEWKRCQISKKAEAAGLLPPCDFSWWDAQFEAKHGHKPFAQVQ